MAMALPPLVFFRFQVKRTTPVDFEKGIRTVATKCNAAVCKRTTRARDDLIEQFTLASRSPEHIPPQRIWGALETYLSCLAGFMHPPGDLGTESALKTLLPFYWGPTVAAAQNFADRNAFYDAANVLLNYAICCLNYVQMRIQATSNRDQAEKECYAICNEAAGCLQLAHQLLREHVQHSQGYPSDSTPEFVAALQSIALGQAQELGFRRAVAQENDKYASAGDKNPALLCRLAHQCANLYSEAARSLQPQARATEKLSCLTKYAQLKAQVYHTYTLIGMGLHCNKGDDNGAAMLCADQAVKGASAAVADGKSNVAIVWKAMQELCAAALLEAESKAAKFEKENDMLYHQRKAEVLPELLPPQVLARPKQVELPLHAAEWDGDAYAEFVVRPPPNMPPPGRYPAAPPQPPYNHPGLPQPPGHLPAPAHPNAMPYFPGPQGNYAPAPPGQSAGPGLSQYRTVPGPYYPSSHAAATTHHMMPSVPVTPSPSLPNPAVPYSMPSGSLYPTLPPASGP